MWTRIALLLLGEGYFVVNLNLRDSGAVSLISYLQPTSVVGCHGNEMGSLMRGEPDFGLEDCPCGHCEMISSWDTFDGVG